MAADRLPDEVREFAHYLDGLLARLDPSGGWCAVFWRRDPEGMRACLDGREMPPWDVVEALLHDLAGQYGPGGAGPETERARSLHAAALAAYDARPGGRDALGDRLDVMLREQKYAAERRADLTRLLATAATREEADALRLDFAWAHDDHERATARCAELRARMADLDRREREASHRVWGAGDGRGAAGVPGATAGMSGGAVVAEGAAPGGRRGPRGGGSPDEDGTWSGAWRRPTGKGFAVADGGSGPGAAPVGRADVRDGEYPAGRGASGEAAVGGTPGAFAARVGRADAQGREYAAGGAESREGAAGGASGGFAAPVGRSDARDGEEAAGPAASREAAVGGAVGAFEAAARTDRTSREAAAAGTPGVFAAPAPSDAEPTAPHPVTPKQRKRRRGSARFAGVVEEDAAPVVVPPAAVPLLPEPAPVTGRRRPRGARFAGAAEEVGEARAEPQVVDVGGAERRDVVQAVEALARLRKEGRSGEAHALLVEAATWAPARFPLLADELERAGLGADWQTLLWEAASLPAGRLVAAADALGAAGRAGDGQQILRQGVARPPGEIGQAVLGLVAERRHREVRALLDAYVRVRTPEEAARSAEPGPQTLVPLLLEAAQGVSDERRWDLLHALRVAGLPA
ncbi:hypothetical protein [Streptomyces swartbergensis]|uniref:hypothetical protein n=1 Tax=Streptomyces swartbergensis TaxID=487165 RepID=UPI0037FA5F5E